MKRTFFNILICTVVLAGDARLALAQSGGGFTIGFSTIDGGGGPSAGGSFSLNGTIGQPDAGEMSGGAFTLSGGFWTIPHDGSQPFLAIRHGTGDTVILSWPDPSTGYLLEAAPTTLGGGWTTVTQTPVVVAGEKQVTLTPTGPGRMFRLRKP